MAKRGSPKLTNEKIVETLYTRALISASEKDSENRFATLFKEFDKWEWSRASGYTKKHIIWYNYMIPIDIYHKYIDKKFKAQFDISNMVQIRKNSTRKIGRTKNQAVGDSLDFQHTGIGSGKTYNTEKLDDAYQTIPYYYRQNYNTKILISNKQYPSNLLYALDQVNYFKNKGIKKSLGDQGFYSNSNFNAHDFIKFIKIKPDGIFGPKKIINGYITNVFVHFLYPKWDKKREARYEVTLETGAKGIFTNDYIKRVFHTDYEVDEKLMDGCSVLDCAQREKCDHTKVHLYDNECDQPCFVCGRVCQAIYDYTNLFDMTHGTALDLEGE